MQMKKNNAKMMNEMELTALSGAATTSSAAAAAIAAAAVVQQEEDEAAAACTPQNSKAEQYLQKLNATNAKKVALLIVLGFVAYHGLLYWQYGSDSCQWLLSKGRFKGDKEWQPYGCMMHKYSQTDTRHCLQYLAFWGNKNDFVFIGDAGVKLLYDSFVNHLQTNALKTNGNVTLQDTSFEDGKLSMHCIYIFADEFSDALLERLTKFDDELDKPAIFVIGFTHHKLLAGNVSKELLKAYKTNLKRLVAPFDRLVAKKSKVLWKQQDRINEEKLPENWKLLQNDDIDKFNEVAEAVFHHSDVVVWHAAWHISNGLLENNVQGWQASALSLRHNVQLLLNMYCNDHMNYNDGTCCSSAEQYTNLQIVSYAVLAVCIALAFGMCCHRWLQQLRGKTLYVPLQQHATTTTTTADSTNDGAQLNVGGPPQLLDYSKPIIALSLLGIIMAYFYLCDRTNFFMKENKYYSEFSFWIPVAYVFALGLFFTEHSRYTKVLNRDQTDEIKGWILLVLLIYYMTGAHRVLPIHMHMRLLISGYIFLTGFTHFSYIWQTGNSGFVRFFQVMFRLNFMTVVLCFCMNRPYQFYYFVPLLSFWLCVIYFLLLLPPRITAQSVEQNGLHYLYLVGKFVGCFSVVTILFMSEVFFERIFVTRPWKALFVSTDDDIHEWWYQWKLDRYTVMFGMIFAACFHIAQKHNVFDDNNHGNLFARRTSITVTLLALLGVSFYTTFSFFCRNEQNCEEIHSYVLFIPIIGFIVLRNISGILRTRYSTLFAWFGRISLELFICQYHIWLAADRNGVLVLLPGFPTLNMIITTFIFVCASHEVNRITQILLPYAVPNDWKLIMRNFVVFLVVLVPIAHSDGMF